MRTCVCVCVRAVCGSCVCESLSVCEPVFVRSVLPHFNHNSTLVIEFLMCE